MDAGDVLLFHVEHMHASELNSTALTRSGWKADW